MKNKLKFKINNEDIYRKKMLKVEDNILKKTFYNFAGKNKAKLNDNNLNRLDRSFIINKNLNISFPKKKYEKKKINEKDIKYYSSVFEEKKIKKYNYFLKLSDIIENIEYELFNYINIINFKQFKNEKKLSKKIKLRDIDLFKKFKNKFIDSKTKYKDLDSVCNEFKANFKKVDLNNILDLKNLNLLDEYLLGFFSLENKENKFKTTFINDLFYLLYIFNKKNYEKLYKNIKNIKTTIKKKFLKEKKCIEKELNTIILENIKLKRKQSEFEEYPKKLKNLLSIVDLQFIQMNNKINILKRENKKLVTYLNNNKEELKFINIKYNEIDHFIKNLEYMNTNNFNNIAILKIKECINEVKISLDNLTIVDKNFKKEKVNNYKKEYKESFIDFNYNKILNNNLSDFYKTKSTQIDFKPLNHVYINAVIEYEDKVIQTEKLNYSFNNINNKNRYYPKEEKESIILENDGEEVSQISIEEYYNKKKLLPLKLEIF